MDMEWGSPGAKKFVTNVGIITSNGPHGHNIMAAEWTRQISYSPGLIMINLSEDNATTRSILHSKIFGVNIAADDQNILSSVAGGHTGEDVDKIAVLKELGFDFYNAEKIDVMMVSGAALNLECKVMKSENIGSHVMIIGEIVAMKVGDKEPLVFHGGKYYRLTERIEKPSQDVLDKINALIDKHTKK